MSTPTLDKYSLHPVGGYCTCFSSPYSRCEICAAIAGLQARWEALPPDLRKQAQDEYDEKYPKTPDGPGR